MLSQAQRKMRERTLRAIVEFAPAIAEICHEAKLEPTRLLKAFAVQESGLGTDLGPNGLVRQRVEPSYMPDGHYYKRSQPLREAYARWGQSVAASHGPWQILWATAIRFGWEECRNPNELGYPEENCKIVTNFINKELGELISLRKLSENLRYKDMTLLSLLADAYNSGNARDRIIPTRYMMNVGKHYDAATESEECP